MTACRKCGIEKPLTEFYGSDRNKCKECVKLAVSTNRAANIDYYRSYEASRATLPHRVKSREEYLATESGKAAKKRASDAYEARFPEKTRARRITRNAIRFGRLVNPGVCSIDGCSAKPEAHHPDYSKPLKVVWLCSKHHHEEHERLRSIETKAA